MTCEYNGGSLGILDGVSRNVIDLGLSVFVIVVLLRFVDWTSPRRSMRRRFPVVDEASDDVVEFSNEIEDVVDGDGGIESSHPSSVISANPCV